MAKTDGSTRAIQDIVRKSVGTVSRYTTSIGKMFLASTGDFITAKMPAPAAFYDTNKDILNDTIRFLRNPVDAINKGVNRAMETEDFKALAKFAKYAVDDLKTGKLYDADRSRDDWGMQMDMDISEFGGFDMSGFDENGDWDADSTDDDFDKQIALAEAQDKSQAKRTEATINAIGTSTQAIVDTENANAQVSLRMSMKQHSQSMQAMQSMVAAQSATFELINKSINSAMDVTREAHNQIMESLNNINTTLTKIQENTTPKETEKTQYKDRNTVFDINGSLNLKNYFKQISKNVDDKFGLSSMYSVATGGMGVKGLVDLAINNPWKLLSDLAVSSIAGPKVTKQMELTNRNMESFFPALLQKWADRGKKFENGKSESPIDLLLGVLGVDTRSRSSIDTEYENPLSAANFTSKTTRAIEEVIPMWLARIDSHISGQPLMVYNYATGKLEKATDIVRSGERSARDLVGGMNDGAREIMARAGQYRFRNDKEQQDFKDYTYRFLQKQASESGFINPYLKKEDFMDMMPSTNGNSRMAEKYYSLLMGILRNMPEDKLMSLSSEIMSSRSSRDRTNYNLNERLKSDGTIAAWSFMDPEIVDKISSGVISKQYSLNDEDIDKITDARRKEILSRGGTPATNLLIKDITSILRKGIITYSYSLGRANETKIGSLDDNLRKTIDKVKSDATRQYTYENNLAERLERINRSRESSIDYQNRRARTIMANGNYDESSYFVLDDITADSAEKIQASIILGNTALDEINNHNVEAYRRSQIQERNRNAVDLNVNGTMRDIVEKSGMRKILDTLRTVSEEPFKLFSSGLQCMDAFMYKALFGDAALANVNINDEPHLLQVLTNSIAVHFKQAKDVIKDVIADPVQKYLLDDRTGLLPRIGAKLKEITEPITNGVKDRIFGAKDETGQRQGGLIGKFKNKTIGRKDDTGKYTNGIFSGVANSITDRSSDLQTRVNNAIDQVLWGDYANKERRGVNKTSEGLGVGGDGSYNPDDYQGVMGKLKLQFDKFNYFMFGSEDSNSKLQLVKKNLNEAAPDMLIGAGAGLLTSFFLPGGPVLGAVLGGAVGLLKGSSDLKNFLFGKEFDDTETYIDKKTGKTITKTVKRRPGGILSQQVYDGFKQYAPKMGAGALLGGIAGGLGILPFGLGTMAGSVIGAVGGMLGASDKVKELIFGKIEDPKSGLISKDFREKAKGAIKKYAPSSIIGALAGGTAWNLISGLGIIPGLSLLPGGPIFTALGGMMGMANAETFNKFLFGEESEEKGEDGKIHKVRKGGVFGKAFDFTKEKILTPLGNKINKAGESIANWFHDGIITPLENSIQPLKDEIGKAGNAIFTAFKNIGDSLTRALFGVFHVDIGEGLGDFMKSKVLPKLDEMTNKMFSAIGKVIGGIISAPFKALELLVTGRIGGKTIDEINDEKAAERQQKKDERDKRRRDKHFKAAKRAAKRGGEDAAGHAGSFFARLFGMKGSKRSGTRGFNGLSGSDSETPIGGTPTAEETPVYRQGADGRWRDARGRFVSAAIADPNYNKNNSSDMKGATNAEQRADRAKRTNNEIGAKNDRDANRKTDEERNRERNTRGKGKRDTNSYLAEIARYTRTIKDEIKGQIGGVGWNTAYIRAALDAHWGPLSSDQLPEEMEGSTKNVKKKRGIIGKIVDRSKDLFSEAGDWLSGKVKSIKSGAGKVIEFIFAPFKLLGAAAKGLVNTAKDLGSGLKIAIGDLWEGLKKVGNLLYMGAETIMKTVGNIMINSARGIGESIGNALSTVTGLVKDATLTVSAILKGAVTSLAEAFPGIISFLGKGAVKLGKGAWKMAKGVGNLGIHAITGIGGAIADKIIPGRKDRKEKIKKKYLGNVHISGGTVDEVKKVNIETIGGETTGVPFPHVSVIGGVAKAAGSHAIPVYVLGVDPLAKIHTIDRRDDSSSPTKADKRYIKAYKKADNAAEHSSNPAETYDRSVDRAETRSEIEAIQAAALMNVNNTGLSSSESAEKKPGIFSKLLELLVGGKGTLGKILSALLGGASVKGILQTVLSGGTEAAAKGGGSGILGLLGGAAYNTTSSKGQKSWGVHQILQAILQGTGISKLTGAQFMAAMKNPEKVTQLGELLGEKGIINAGKLGGLAQGARGLVGKVGEKMFGGLGTAISANMSKTGLAVAGGAANVGPIKNLIAKIIAKALSLPGIKQAAGALATKIPQLTKTVTSFVSEKILPKAIKQAGSATVKATAKQAAALSTGGILAVGFAVYDFISGMGSANQYFSVYSSQVTLGMKVASGICKMLGGLLTLVPGIGGLLSIAAAMALPTLAQLLYAIVADKDTEKELATKQQQLAADCESYNAQNGTNYSTSEYAKKFNEDGSERKGILSRIGSGIKSIGSAAWKGIKTAGSWIGSGLSSAWDGVKSVGSKIGSAVGSAWSGAKEFAGKVGDKASELYNKIPGNTIDEKIFGLLGTVKGAYDGFWISMPQRITGFLSSAGSMMKNGLDSAASSVSTFMTETVPTFIANARTSIGNFFSNTVSGIGDFFTNLGKSITEGFTNAIKFVKEIPGKVKDAVTGAFDNAGEWVGDRVDDLKTTGSNIWGGITSGVSNFVGGVKNKVTSWGNAISTGYKSGNKTGTSFMNSNYGTGHSMKKWTQRSGALNQADPTMRSAGCGPVAAAMVASAYGRSANPVEASNLSYASGMRAADGGMNPAFFGSYAASKGFGMGVGPTDVNMINANLSNNQPVVLMGRGGAFGPDTHYLVANNIGKNGSIGIVDPWTGGFKSVNAKNLIGNTSTTVYSSGKGWGRGTDTASSGGVSTAQAQQALANKMISLSQHPIAYSLQGPQDPDQGSASCASTVAWAYRKVLGVKGMSASSAKQSTDSRFTDVVRLGQPGAAPGKDFDISVLQPGDIVYMHNPTSNHTEMYIGNGKTMSHGGPGAGPNVRTLDANRRKRVFAVRRYNDFVNNKTVKIIDNSAVTKDWNNAESNSNGEASDYTSNTVGDKFLTSLTNAINPFTNKIGNILNIFNGSSADSTSSNIDSAGSSVGSAINSTTITASLQGNSNGKKIWNYFKGKGLSTNQIAGIMGNLYAESGLNPNNLQNSYEKSLGYTDDSYTKAVDDKSYTKFSKDSAGYGLAQWTYGARKANLLATAQKNGRSIGDLGTQLDFLWSELANGSGKVLDKIKNTSTTNDATEVFMKQFERPADTSATAVAKRQGYAQQMIEAYGTGRKKRLSTIPQLTSWGTGNSTNLSAMNEKIRNVNSAINKIRNEAETGSTVSQVTSAITNAVKETSAKSNGESDAAVLTLLTKSLATMIELLSDIKDNTKKTSSEEVAATSSTNNLPTVRANMPTSESGYGNNGTDIGASIIDSLTKK